MESVSTKSTSWTDEEWLEVTGGPGVSVAAVAETAPTLTVATIVGVTLVVLVAIAAVFVFGVLIDCRQQRLLDRKMDEARRLKQQQRRSRGTPDTLSIAVQMEETDHSVPPAEMLRNIP